MSKGLFINDVITFGGYPDPPPLPLVIMSWLNDVITFGGYPDPPLPLKWWRHLWTAPNEEEENCNYHYDDGDTGAAVDNNGENFLMKTTLSTPLCIFNGIPPDCDDDTTVCQLSNPSSIQHLSWPSRGSIYQSSLLIIFVVTLRHIFQRLDII